MCTSAQPVVPSAPAWRVTSVSLARSFASRHASRSSHSPLVCCQHRNAVRRARHCVPVGGLRRLIDRHRRDLYHRRPVLRRRVICWSRVGWASPRQLSLDAAARLLAHGVRLEPQRAQRGVVVERLEECDRARRVQVVVPQVELRQDRAGREGLREREGRAPCEAVGAQVEVAERAVVCEPLGDRDASQVANCVLTQVEPREGAVSREARGERGGTPRR
mmetsp:Transcript_56600/g.148571  ORF Transcript_56600/g.148571 Transcript_56600/m.148571 type:complete len:219 (-) Transcript_56600:150-806(-)